MLEDALLCDTQLLACQTQSCNHATHASHTRHLEGTEGAEGIINCERFRVGLVEAKS